MQISYTQIFVLSLFVCLLGGAQRHFQQYFSYIVPVSFIGGGNQGTWRKPFSLLQCHQNNKNAHKRKAHTNVILMQHVLTFSIFFILKRSYMSPNPNLKCHAILLTISDSSMNWLLTKFTIFRVKLMNLLMNAVNKNTIYRL